jgi:hypothetical protein
MRTRVVLLIALGGLAACAGSGGGGSAPPSPAASEPGSCVAAASSPAALGLSCSGSPVGSLAGHWKVAAGSVAGYRVHETFLGQDHEAVARTAALTGGVDIDAGGTTATNLQVSADLTRCRGVDSRVSYVGFNRDSVVQRALDTADHPDATLTVASLALPAGAASGSAVDLAGTGTFSMNGQSHTVHLALKGLAEGGRLEVAGSFTVSLSDFAVSLPHPPFTSASDTGTVEVDVFLARGS